VSDVSIQPAIAAWIEPPEAANALLTTAGPWASHLSVPKPVPGPPSDYPQTLVCR
jgi:hypothetical protein